MTCLTFKACGLVAFCVLLFPGVGCSSDSADKGTETSMGGSSSGGTNKMLSCAVSRCINDTASSHFEDEGDCDVIWNGPCPTEYKAYQKCLFDNEMCDAEGQPDVDSVKACAAAADALGTCSTDSLM